MAEGDRELRIVIKADGTLANATLDETAAKGTAAAEKTSSAWTTGFATFATGLNQARELLGAAWESASALVEKGIADNKQEEEATIQLTTALQAHGHAIDANVQASQRYADAAMRRFAIDDDEILKLEAVGAAYGLTGGDIQKFAEASIATAERTGKSVEASGLIVEKAMGGQVRAYHGVGVEIDTSATKSQVLDQITTGLAGSLTAAQDKAQGYEGQLKLLNAQYDNALGAVAKLITQSPDFLAIIGGAAKAAGDLTTIIDNWRTSTDAAGKQQVLTANEVEGALLDGAADVLTFTSRTSTAIKELWNGLEIGVGEVVTGITEAIYSIGKAYNAVAEFTHQPLIDIESQRVSMLAAQETLDSYKNAAGAALDAQQKTEALITSMHSQATAARAAADDTAKLNTALGEQAEVIDGAGAGGDIAKPAKAKGGGGKGGTKSAVDGLALSYAALGGAAKGAAAGQSFLDSLGLPPSDRNGGDLIPALQAAGGAAWNSSASPWGGSPNVPGSGPGRASGYGLIPLMFGQGGRNGAGTYDPSQYPGSQTGPYDFSGGAGIQELLQFYLAKGLINQATVNAHLVDPNQGNPYAGPGGHDLVRYDSLGSTPGRPLWVAVAGAGTYQAETAMNTVNASAAR